MRARVGEPAVDYGHIDALCLGLRFHQRHHGLDHLNQRSRADVVGEMTRLDAAEVEQVGDDSHQVLLALPYSLQIIDLLRRYWAAKAKAE